MASNRPDSKSNLTSSRNRLNTHNYHQDIHYHDIHSKKSFYESEDEHHYNNNDNNHDDEFIDYDRKSTLRSKSMDRRGQQKQQRQDESKTYYENLTSASKIKQFYERLLESKEAELVALRNTHQRRLERLISLEKEHKLLLEHVEAVEMASPKTNATESIDVPNAVRMKLNGRRSQNDKENGFNLIGYKRKDGESMWNEMKLLRTENGRLKAENLSLKEACDLFEIKLSEKMEEIEALQLELNVNLNERQVQFGATKVLGSGLTTTKIDSNNINILIFI